VRILYSLLLYCLTPLLLLRLLWRGLRAPAYLRRWPERFGWRVPSAWRGGVWIHAVSFGEVQAAVPLIKALQNRAVPLLVTTMTPTGSQRVRELFGDRVEHVYLPYDFPGASARFIKATRPRLGILLETELWPNLLHTCHAQAVPVALINARLSARSAARYAYAPGLAREMLGHLSAVAAQSEADARRLIELGARPAKVNVTGSLKFEIAPPPCDPALRAMLGRERPVWIAASTHEGEEEQVLAAFSSLREKFPDLLLILVPRHPERFNRVADLCRRAAYPLIRRSEGGQVSAATAIYLGDTMGELPLLYAAADVAFVGGSLMPVGGHNPLEPAALAVPVVVGPHTFNFEEITRRLLAESAARQVQDGAELAGALAEYLSQPKLRRCHGDNARRFVEANRGALERVLKVLEALADLASTKQA
jgi:3-deoxy-D-manno-octulosonic-acid transferase